MQNKKQQKKGYETSVQHYPSVLYQFVGSWKSKQLFAKQSISGLFSLEGICCAHTNFFTGKKCFVFLTFYNFFLLFSLRFSGAPLSFFWDRREPSEVSTTYHLYHFGVSYSFKWPSGFFKRHQVFIFQRNWSVMIKHERVKHAGVSVVSLFAVHLQHTPVCSQLSTYTSEGSKGQFMVSLLNTSSVI